MIPTQPRLIRARRAGRRLAAPAVFCLLLLPFVWRLESASFHLDETSWILVSDRVVRATFVERDFDGPDLAEYGFSFGWPNPPLGKYLIGGSMWLRGGRKPPDLSSTSWATYDRPIVASIATHQTPPLDSLVSARLPMALLGAATCLVVFAIGCAAWGGRAGAIAAFLLALNPLMLTCCRRAMVDAPALFFSTLAVLLSAVVADRTSCAIDPAGSRTRPWVTPSIALGVALGLAIASKFNALAALGACLVALVLTPLASGGSRRPVAAAAGVALLIAVLVFVAVNPYLYSDPLRRGWSMLTYAHNQPAVTTLGERALLLIRRLLAGEVDPQGLTYLTFRSLLRAPLEWILLPAGFFLTAASCARNRGRAVPSVRVAAPVEMIVLSWWVVTMISVGMWLPQDWERYYLPPLPPTVLMVARALDRAVEWLPSGATILRGGRQTA